MELKLNDGRKVEVRDLNENEDVFVFCDFINSLVQEDTFIACTVTEYTPEQEMAWLQRQAEKMRRGKCIHVLAVDAEGGAIVAGARAECEEGKQGHVAEVGVAVKKGWRDVGLGRSLLEHVIQRTRMNPDIRILYLKVFGNNERAMHLYESMGFREIARLPGFLKHKGEQVDEVYMVLRGF